MNPSLILFKMTVSSKNWTEQAGNTFSLMCSSWRYSTRRVYALYMHPEPDSQLKHLWNDRWLCANTR